jgi:hypothetical protein
MFTSAAENLNSTEGAATRCVKTLDIKSLQNRLLKVCYVPTTSAGLNRVLFWLQPLTVLMKQTRQAVCAIKQSIFLMSMVKTLIYCYDH